VPPATGLGPPVAGEHPEHLRPVADRLQQEQVGRACPVVGGEDVDRVELVRHGRLLVPARPGRGEADGRAVRRQPDQPLRRRRRPGQDVLPEPDAVLRTARVEVAGVDQPAVRLLPDREVHPAELGRVGGPGRPDPVAGRGGRRPLGVGPARAADGRPAGQPNVNE
jgi:hypothetical protein